MIFLGIGFVILLVLLWALLSPSRQVVDTNVLDALSFDEEENGMTAAEVARHARIGGPRRVEAALVRLEQDGHVVSHWQPWEPEGSPRRRLYKLADRTVP